MVSAFYLLNNLIRSRFIKIFIGKLLLILLLISYIALEFKKWYSFNAINGFSNEQITRIKSDMRKLKEVLEIRPEASTYFVLFLVDYETMNLPLDIKYYNNHNKIFGLNQKIYDNRIKRIEKYLENGLKINKSNIEYHRLGKHRGVNFNLFVVYVEIKIEYDIDRILSKENLH
jgi:hypothetical protein